MNAPLRRLARGLVAVLLLLGAGCDFVIVVLAILFIGPLYPGLPQPPPPPPDCPITVPSGEAPPPVIPDDLDTDLDAARVAACAIPDRPALARQNRDELERSLQALTGVDAGLKDALPPDATGAGLDVIAELLTVSPLLVERLEGSAFDVIERALRLPGDAPTTTTIEAETTVTGRDEAGLGLVTVAEWGRIGMPIQLPLAGTWAIRVRLLVEDRGDNDELALLRLHLDGDAILDTRLAPSDGETVVVQVRHTLRATDDGIVQPIHRLEIEHGGGPDAFLIDAVEVEGPFDPPSRGPITASRAQPLPCGLGAAGLPCARTALPHFAFRAGRGQVTSDDVARLHALLDTGIAAGDDVETALTTAMAGVLLSPRFLFRLELDPAVTAPDDEVAPGVRALSDQELATRLAAYLWSSTPDDRLLELAHQGVLRDERVLLGEARRMLDDPRSTAVVDRFFAMWLGLDALEHVRPDPTRFPGFDEDLRRSMRCEAELLVDRALRDGGSLDDVLTGDVAALNHRLASHYGLPPPDLDDDSARGGYVDTSLVGLRRQGLLGTGAVLTMTSQPTRTSPTRRGAWVLSRLMCTTPPPPPPGVEGLVEDETAESPASVRALLEAHRQNPECASCHDVIDPMGLPLESFDAVGRWRGSDGAFAIDDSAFWFGDEGDVVRGAAELAQRLADDEGVDRCLAQQALSYGAGVIADDEHGATCAIDDVTARAAAAGGRLSDVLLEVVRSPAFRVRRLGEVSTTSRFETRGAP